MVVSKRFSFFTFELQDKYHTEKHIAVIQKIYKGRCTCIHKPVGKTNYFIVEVDLHQGSALSLLLFIIAMDVIGTLISWKLAAATPLREKLVEINECTARQEQMKMIRNIIRNYFDLVMISTCLRYSSISRAQF